MKWLKRILIAVGAFLLIAIVAIGVIGYFVTPENKGMTITVTAGGKKVIATALEAVNQKDEGNAVTVTLDNKHVIFVSPDSLKVNGEDQPFTAKVVRIKSLKDGTVKVEQSSE